MSFQSLNDGDVAQMAPPDFVLGDFRGDVWLMELEPDPHKAAANSE